MYDILTEILDTTMPIDDDDTIDVVMEPKSKEKHIVPIRWTEDGMDRKDLHVIENLFGWLPFEAFFNV